MQKRNEPILPGTAATDYERYLRTDDLLSLQKDRSEAVHRDELLFQTVHQTSELWLKLGCREIEDATSLIDGGRVPDATRLLRRANECVSLTTANLHMLDHLSPVDYAVVRTALGHGAGFDSPGFKALHHVSPLAGEAFTRVLARRGATVLDVYERGYDMDDLYQLAEQLLTLDERVILWRFHHLKVVERIIGGQVVGTQGTPVEVLERRIDVRFFPELWDVRNAITRRSPLGADGHASR